MSFLFGIILCSPIRFNNSNSRQRSLLFHLRSHIFFCSLAFKVGGSAHHAFIRSYKIFLEGAVTLTLYSGLFTHSLTHLTVMTCDMNVWGIGVPQQMPRHQDLILRRGCGAALAARTSATVNPHTTSSAAPGGVPAAPGAPQLQCYHP